MARITRKNDDLLNKYYKYNKKKINAYIICGISFFFWMLNVIFINSFNPILIFVLFVGFGGGGALGGYMKQKADSYKSGVDGENATAQIIASLPDTYTGFQNIRITFEGKTSELDMVVVGPTGVFVIETKNMNGTIVGNYDNPQWVQKKVGQQGTPYSKNFYNPIKQVGTHVYRLANYLRNNGCAVHVNDMVYFSNPDTAVQLLGTQPKTPVFTALGNSAREICDYILENEQQISENVVCQICELLDK